ncbi:MAG: carbamoyltransferase C-terminal domain-containing protein [Deltaproteobacteria bacterium]|nr:carbamoyltransferase C-terminal domain-containing protein [Deltaproteobacteria bacterium]
MRVLGFNCYAHNAAAALVEDGRLTHYVQEERLSRRKHDGRLPRLAMAWCLEQAGLRADELDAAAFHWQPLHGLPQRGRMLLQNLPRALRMGSAHGGTYADLLQAGARFRSTFGLGRRHPPLTHVRHHLAHAASAFLPSPFDSAAILTLDGNGEIASTQLAMGEGSRIRVLEEVDYPHSLGYLYAAVTHYLGFDPEGDQYKVMGLAPFGDESLVERFREVLHPLPGGTFEVDLSYVDYPAGGRDPWVSRRFVETFGPVRPRGAPLEDRHRAVARAMQAALEEVALHLAHRLHQRTGARRLCLAGGVALNSAMNGRLQREGPFEELWIQPAANDAGASIGAALQVYHQLAPRAPRQPLESVFLGPGFGSEEVRRALEASGLPFEQLPEEALVEEVARRLDEGEVLAHFSGRMAVGARALGDRSILADPRRAEMKDRVNLKVKHREPFRPFAPSILEEAAPEWFEGCGRSPYMTTVFPVREGFKDRIPAVTHVDGTARVQTVSAADHPRYRRVIEAFGRRTGVPVVLNTSLNVMGEPIVNTPEEALACLQATDLDGMVIEDFLVRKTG